MPAPSQGCAKGEVCTETVTQNVECWACEQVSMTKCQSGWEVNATTREAHYVSECSLYDTTDCTLTASNQNFTTTNVTQVHCESNGCSGEELATVLPCGLASCTVGSLAHDAVGAVVEVDVTDAVKNAVANNNPYVSFKISSTSSSTIKFGSSRHAQPQTRPVLNVVPLVSTVKVAIDPNQLCMYSGRCDDKVTVSPSTLYFTAENWFRPQTVTVTALGDSVDQNDAHVFITHTVDSLDPDYIGGGLTTTGELQFTPSVNVTVLPIDNDVAAVQLSSSYLSVTEGGAYDSYTVVLASDPIADVTVSIFNTTQAYTSASELTFTSTDWNVPQTVQVHAFDDLRSENVFAGFHAGGVIEHTVYSVDMHYDSSLQCVNVTSWDNVAHQHCAPPPRFEKFSDSSLLTANFEHGTAKSR